MGEVDLGLIERTECPKHGNTLTVARMRDPLRYCITCGSWVKTVRVEYVPRAALTGAVEALREIARLPCQYPDDPEQDSKMALDSVKAQEIAHAALGGQ